MKFVSLTNGDAGHQPRAAARSQRRRAEAQEAGRGSASEYQVLDNHDGELLPTLAAGSRSSRPSASSRPTWCCARDRTTITPTIATPGILVQDAAYMVTVPNVAP